MYAPWYMKDLPRGNVIIRLKRQIIRDRKRGLQHQIDESFRTLPAGKTYFSRLDGCFVLIWFLHCGVPNPLSVLSCRSEEVLYFTLHTFK